MSKILFTGAATQSGGFMVAKLRDLGHQVFTVGKGDSGYNSDFIFVGISAVNDFVKYAVAKLRGVPDVVIHNARTAEPSVFSHAMMVNVTARVYIDQALFRMGAGEKSPFRSIHIIGTDPLWWLEPSAPEITVSRAAQMAVPSIVRSVVQYAKTRAAETDLEIEREKKAHLEDMAQQERIHDEFQESTEAFAAAAGQAYVKKPFSATLFSGRVEKLLVPQADAVLLVPNVGQASNGEIKREDTFRAIQLALNLPFKQGEVETLVISTEK